MNQQVRAKRDPLRAAKRKVTIDFSASEAERYSRHILLPKLGATGQARLKASSVFVVGAGGLGSPALLYLASAGVGQIQFCDGDEVDLSNLQRQVLHGTSDISRPKVESALETLKTINPEVDVISYKERVSVDNIAEIIGDVDLVLDGCDNFATRYLVNDYCWFARIPLVSAAVFRFEGQLSVFDQTEKSPCYRCLFPSAPPAGAAPSCAEAGVLGSVVGTLGTMQASEAVKVLTGIGAPLVGKLLRYDALSSDVMTFSMGRDPGCALCGESPSIVKLSAEAIDECTRA